jgi:hypothetical protein
MTGCGAGDDETEVSEGVQSSAAFSSSSPNVSSNSPMSSSAASSVSSAAVSSSASVDTVQPVAPKGLQQGYISTTEAEVSWQTATDNVGVVAYRVYRNGTRIAQVGKDVRKYNDKGLSPDVDYLYTVRAGDAAGNWSSPSSVLRLKTLTESVSNLDKEAVIEWYRPNQRENGDYLELSELGGYEIRYKLITETNYRSALITDGLATRHSLGVLSGSYQFEIAAYDSNGLYSQFVSISPL